MSHARKVLNNTWKNIDASASEATVGMGRTGMSEKKVHRMKLQNLQRESKSE
jgi:hypothetical protein